MAYIYKIVNDINSKIYIGKTEFSIEKRFKEHCRDAFREHNKKRPLYSAIRKYGIEHFHIELIEETDNPEERETYWIEQFGSFKYGYNATQGGDGRSYIDRQQIYNLWKQGLNCKEISIVTGHDIHQISSILKQSGIEPKEILDMSAQIHRKAVCQIDKNGKIKRVFNSLSEACDAMRQEGLTNCKTNTGGAHISEVCRGKRKTFAGFQWKFI